MSAGSAALVASGAVCAIGLSTRQISASMRAGLSGVRGSPLRDRWQEPLRLSLLPDSELEPVAPELDGLPLTSRERRLLRLGAPALRQVWAELDQASALTPDRLLALETAPLFLGLPDDAPLKHATADWTLSEGAARAAALANLPSLLQLQTGVGFDVRHSRVFPSGRAAGLVALDAALAWLETSGADAALVGGIDTYLDPLLLGALDAERRLLGERVPDGFVPGEGAAFLLLIAPSRARLWRAPLVSVLGSGTAHDPGHRYASEPARGEALSTALDALPQTADSSSWPRVQCTWAGLNGESFGAKEWGVATIRHAELFAPEARLEHPADCYGDLGAATGPLLLALARDALLLGHRPGPALVWASSDEGTCACCYVDVAT